MATYIFNGECPSSIKQAFIDTYKPVPAYHADTWYKYANDTEWRTVSITGTISGSSSAPTTQISDVTNVVALEIGSDVTSIGGGAFYECNGLTSVMIGNSVTSIGGSAFFDCSSLKSVTIPDSVTSIGNEAFYYTDNMETITFENRTKSQVQAMQYYSWGTTKYMSSSYSLTITFVCSDGNILLNKTSGGN